MLRRLYRQLRSLMGSPQFHHFQRPCHFISLLNFIFEFFDFDFLEFESFIVNKILLQLVFVWVTCFLVPGELLQDFMIVFLIRLDDVFELIYHRPYVHIFWFAHGANHFFRSPILIFYLLLITGDWPITERNFFGIWRCRLVAFDCGAHLFGIVKAQDTCILRRSWATSEPRCFGSGFHDWGNRLILSHFQFPYFIVTFELDILSLFEPCFQFFIFDFEFFNWFNIFICHPIFGILRVLASRLGELVEVLLCLFECLLALLILLLHLVQHLLCQVEWLLERIVYLLLIVDRLLMIRSNLCQMFYFAL